jgi:hypothetical protein
MREGDTVVIGPTPEEAEHLGEYGRLSGMVPYLQAEVDRMDAQLETRVFKALEAGKLTPEEALSAWMEKRALKRLLQKIEHKVKLGTSAAIVQAG